MEENVVRIGLLLLALLLLLFVGFWIAAWVRIGRLKRRLERFVKSAGIPDLESAITTMYDKAEESLELSQKTASRVNALEQQLSLTGWKIGILRYNAYGEIGNDLSFSIAMVNEKLDGVVISSLHSRDESRVYAKPLKSGVSDYLLTPEEKEAINQANRNVEDGIAVR